MNRERGKATPLTFFQCVPYDVFDVFDVFDVYDVFDVFDVYGDDNEDMNRER